MSSPSGQAKGMEDCKQEDNPFRWHFFSIEPGFPHRRIGSMLQTKKAIAGMIGHAYEVSGARYLCVAAFAIGPDRQVLWNPNRGRYVFDHEVHFLRIPDEDGETGRIDSSEAD